MEPEKCALLEGPELSPDLELVMGGTLCGSVDENVD